MSHESAILDPVSNAPQLTAWLQRARAQSTDTKRGRMYRLHGAPPPEALTALCLYAPRAAQNRMLNAEPGSRRGDSAAVKPKAVNETKSRIVHSCPCFPFQHPPPPVATVAPCLRATVAGPYQ